VRQLAVHLCGHGVVASAEKIQKPGQKGGFTSYDRLRKHVIDRLNGDTSLFVTTMIDLYGPLQSGGFPGFGTAPSPASPYRRVQHLEHAFLQDIAQYLADTRRFIPHLQLHEFESLVLAEPRAMDWIYLEERHQTAIKSLESLVRGFESPELINEGAQTAPSKRIAAQIPEYNKRLAASVVVGKIGIEKLKKCCPHFAKWVERLEQLP
jgi:hypothetical protein